MPNQSCCFRETVGDSGRCIWHLDSERVKLVDELNQQRETTTNQKLNRRPRELLRGAKLSSATLDEELFTSADLSGSVLKDASLKNAYFKSSILSEVVFTGAVLRDATLSDADLRGADLREVSAIGTSLFRADLRDASLRDADLRDASLRDADLRRADLTGADLRGVNFAGANLTDAKLSGAKVSENPTREEPPEIVAAVNSGVLFRESETRPTDTEAEPAKSTDDRSETTETLDDQADSEPKTDLSDSNDATQEARTEIKPTVESVAAHSTLDSGDVERTVQNLVERGASRSEALYHAQQYAIGRWYGEGLYAVKSVGPTSGFLLAQAGVNTLTELKASSLDEILGVDGLRRDHAKRIYTNAHQGVTNQPLKDMEERDREVASDTTPTRDETGNNTISVSDTSGLNSDEPRTVSVGDRRITVNQLSEYYESLRSLRQVIRAVMLHPRSGFTPDDLRDPYVQYLVMLDTCIENLDTRYEFMGYGSQHTRRLPFRIKDYREAFGDGEWVTEYAAINVHPLHEETQEWLESYTDLQQTHRFVRPVAPEYEKPLPEIVGSLDELYNALALLSRLPAYPPLPIEAGTSNRTIPVAEIYAGLFADVEDEHVLDNDRLSLLEKTDAEPLSGPVVDSTPTSTTEVEDFLVDYGKLTHLHRRVKAPSDSPVKQSLSVFALDWYRPSSPSFNALQELAKHGNQKAVPAFRKRLRDMVHRRFIRDDWDYDYITVFPGHEKGSRSSSLVELAQDAVTETSVIYTPILERTETTNRQRGSSREERMEAARHPKSTLRAHSKLEGASVIILDDICTTGSSLLAGSHILREAGANRVVGLTLGLTPGSDELSTTEIKEPTTCASEIIAGLD